MTRFHVKRDIIAAPAEHIAVLVGIMTWRLQHRRPSNHAGFCTNKLVKKHLCIKKVSGENLFRKINQHQMCFTIGDWGTFVNFKNGPDCLLAPLMLSKQLLDKLCCQTTMTIHSKWHKTCFGPDLGK